jgi:hypothetical protein
MVGREMMEVVGEGGSRRWEDGWEALGVAKSVSAPAAPRIRMLALGKGWGMAAFEHSRAFFMTPGFALLLLQNCRNRVTLSLSCQKSRSFSSMSFASLHLYPNIGNRCPVTERWRTGSEIEAAVC